MSTALVVKVDIHVGIDLTVLGSMLMFTSVTQLGASLLSRLDILSFAALLSGSAGMLWQDRLHDACCCCAVLCVLLPDSNFDTSLSKHEAQIYAHSSKVPQLV